ncbi:minor capsid protein [Agrilactobacillus yilanensis]|uniref:Minor capsid protein n=1 Tax=Agrilactobacillus yilanensis TaxID=2485997 RepID=A0ABW4J5S2_9LACO|nr:minor capsid protein [Agrilactobacillus yilanensis]
MWQNYQQELPSYLMDSLFRATVMGWGPQKVMRQMHIQFQDVQRNQIHRLVSTEMAHISEEATARSYEESDIEQYEYMATLESHTCTVCAHLDGEIFKMSEKKEGINYPLIHPHCRCTTVPHIEGLPDVRERWMRDPETGKGKRIKDVKFDEWNKSYGIQQSGAIYGALNDKNDPGQIKRTVFANDYYQKLRNADSKSLIASISNSAKLSTELVGQALNHILNLKYELFDPETYGTIVRTFDPSYDMAQSLQRLRVGTPLKHDIIMCETRII